MIHPTGIESRMATESSLFPEEYRPALEGELRENFDGKEGLLYQMLVYQLGWTDEQGAPATGLQGDQLLPYLSLLACQSLSGDFSAALPAAACIQMVNSFSQIHEDVQSGSPERDNRSTVWWVWGPGQAINAGDGMHALARLALMRLGERGVPVERTIEALRTLDQSCLEMCEGQHLDLTFQGRADVSIDAYLRMASSKTGALMSCAPALGALAASDDAEVVRAFRDFGRSLGVAGQIIQDVCSLWGSQEDQGTKDNILAKKKLFPVAYSMENGDKDARRELSSIYFKRVLEPEDIQKVVTILDSNDAREHSVQRAGEFGQQAEAALEKIDISPLGREALTRVVRHISNGAG